MTDFVDVTPTPAATAQFARAHLARGRLGAFVELAKPRIAALVLAATAAGFLIAPGTMTGAPAFVLLLNLLVGTALVATGANAFNQYLEADSDARMRRTENRPIPSGRLLPGEVLAFALATSAVGVAQLAIFVNRPAAAFALVTLLVYVLAYTPLKKITPLSVFVGAVPGALPPVIGWTGATGQVAIGAWLLFAIVFFWQLPHFAAIAWLYRDDYRRGGFRVLPVVDHSGRRTVLHVVTHSVGLLAASLFPTLYGLTGRVYTVGAIVLGIWFLGVGILFVRDMVDAKARRHLVVSLVYLPCLFGLMVLDKLAAW